MQAAAAWLEDNSGSKSWDNMVNQGFVVHRPKFFDEYRSCEYTGTAGLNRMPKEA